MSEQNPITPEHSPSGFLAGFNKALPIMNWILTIVVAIGVFVVGSRDTQKDQSFAIQKVEAGQQRLEDTFRQRVEARDKQIESLKQSILTKEVFDVYQKNWTERENRQDELLNKILENQHK